MKDHVLVAKQHYNYAIFTCCFSLLLLPDGRPLFESEPRPAGHIFSLFDKQKLHSRKSVAALGSLLNIDPKKTDIGLVSGRLIGLVKKRNALSASL